MVAISASGNSPNILAAAEWVKRKKVFDYFFNRFDGRKTKRKFQMLLFMLNASGRIRPG